MNDDFVKQSNYCDVIFSSYQTNFGYEQNEHLATLSLQCTHYCDKKKKDRMKIFWIMRKTISIANKFNRKMFFQLEFDRVF